MAGIGRRRGLRVDRQVFMILVGLAVALGLAKLYGPLATSRQQQTELARLRLERAGLVAQQERLEGEKRVLATDAGMEAAARARGYVRDGDRLLVFMPRSKPASRAGSQPALPKSPKPVARPNPH